MLQGLVAILGYLREVHEHVIARFAFDEPVALGVVEPLDLACDAHRSSSLLAVRIFRTGRPEAVVNRRVEVRQALPVHLVTGGTVTLAQEDLFAQGHHLWVRLHGNAGAKFCQRRAQLIAHRLSRNQGISECQQARKLFRLPLDRRGFLCQ